MPMDRSRRVSYIARALTRMITRARTFKVLRRAPVFGILEKEEATKFVSEPSKAKHENHRPQVLISTTGAHGRSNAVTLQCKLYTCI